MAETWTYVIIWNWYCCRYFDWSRHEILTYNDLASPSDKNDGIIDITVSYDGTWHKRGHTSLYGISTIVDILTGFVIDYDLLSKYCPECTTAKRDLGEHSADFSIWYETHRSEYNENYERSSYAMEVKAAEMLWKRSLENCSMLFTSVLSDGDTKTCKHILELDVYGDSMKITKEECLNHVTKKLGTGKF
ncbi:hypothetical protein AVEN_182196-1 [Araneus ventricosus]|uniref:Mutator-like transposase domain-containing protein n=1 Tax=Araneus ventricosus TaxID=182803 RepID=A0A4Y2E1S4_ARAVE|nr:hypothetical protein AVEN_182196-1 [Araneus ventricosus]